MPHGTKFRSVNRHHREVLHVAKIEPKRPSGAKPGLGSLDFPGVCTFSREVLDALVATIRPGNQLVEGCVRRRSAAGLKSDAPRTLYRLKLGLNCRRNDV